MTRETRLCSNESTLNNRGTVGNSVSAWSMPRGYIMRTLAEQELMRVVGDNKKGSLESDTVKYGHESHGSRTWKGLRW
jgi:hypothetical protein